MFNEELPQQPVLLIVDDAISNIKVLREAVRDFGEVLFATTGEAALEIVRTRKPDIVLLDIEMPGMDGYEVCKTIKADPALCDIAILFVTAHNDLGNELDALHFGGIDFLHKPINVPLVRARIQTHLTLQQRTKALTQTRQNLADVVEHLPAFITYWDDHLNNGFCNDLKGRWFGIPASRMRGKSFFSVIGAQNFEVMRPYIEQVLTGKSTSFDVGLTRENLPLLYGHVSLVHRLSEQGHNGFLMLMTDITDRKQAEQSLFDEKEKLRITINSIGDAVVATDVNGLITFMNPIAEAMTGWFGQEAIGQPIENVMPLISDDMQTPLKNPIRMALKEDRIVCMALNSSLLSRDGRRFSVEDSASPIRDHEGNLTGAIIVFHDVSEARAMAIKMSHLAHHDALTNLPNRILLHDRAEQALQYARQHGGRICMMVLDLDHFKSVNESTSHSVGDNILQEVAQRLKQIARFNDTICRRGGDEFILLLPGLESVDQVKDIAEKLRQIISVPVFIDTQRFDITASIGISIFPDDSSDQESLHRHADTAMYQAKQEGRNQYRFFSAAIEEQLLAKHLLERHMRLACEEGKFEVFYQAKVLAATGQITGFEALVRWRNDDNELISPSRFIPLAEETGLIIPIGKFVLLQACKDTCIWHSLGYPVKVCVNISAIQFEEAVFAQTVASVIAETGIDPMLLELEITEGVLAKNHQQARTTLNALKALGVQIAIDDFGTGYSSLAYLKQFPIDVLKIDQSFVRDMLTDKSDAAIITAIIHLGKTLGMHLVAEGVESQEQADSLIDQGCDILQGYLYSRPVPFMETTALLETRQASTRNAIRS